MNDEKRITITFKKDELWLYNLLKKNFSSPSVFIKDFLIEHYRKDGENK